jgi:hypothetical protein
MEKVMEIHIPEKLLPEEKPTSTERGAFSWFCAECWTKSTNIKTLELSRGFAREHVRSTGHGVTVTRRQVRGEPIWQERLTLL